MKGHERISNIFSRLRQRGEKGLITYATAGYPDAAQTLEILKTLADSGSDLIEIGIPFSDPVADGPVIQQSSQQALAGGISLAEIFSIAGRLRGHTNIPVLAMTYYNPVMRAGIEYFVRMSRESGIDGLIVPDLPLEEDLPLRNACRQYGLSLIPLVAPTSTEERLKKITAGADSFIYCVSATGVTGSTNEIKTDLKAFAQRVRSHTEIPLAVGFGVSGPELARRVAEDFDAVVVGSAIVRAVQGNGGVNGIIKRVGSLTGAIKRVLKEETAAVS